MTSAHVPLRITVVSSFTGRPDLLGRTTRDEDHIEVRADAPLTTLVHELLHHMVARSVSDTETFCEETSIREAVAKMVETVDCAPLKAALSSPCSTLVSNRQRRSQTMKRGKVSECACQAPRKVSYEGATPEQEAEMQQASRAFWDRVAAYQTSETKGKETDQAVANREYEPFEDPTSVVTPRPRSGAEHIVALKSEADDVANAVRLGLRAGYLVAEAARGAKINNRAYATISNAVILLSGADQLGSKDEDRSADVVTMIKLVAPILRSNNMFLRGAAQK